MSLKKKRKEGILLGKRGVVTVLKFVEEESSINYMRSHIFWKISCGAIRLQDNGLPLFL